MKTIIIFNLLVTSIVLAQYQYDTIYVNKEITGSYSIDLVLNKTMVSATAYNFGCGDGLSPDGFVVERSYVAFDLSALKNKQGISQAVMGLYQYLSFGDGVSNRFPRFQNTSADSNVCIVDHINYGEALDSSDWTAGDIGDSKTLQSFIGVLSKDSVYEYKYIDITKYILEDLAANRNMSQYRIRFPVLRDYDDYNDFITFRGSYYPPQQPFVRVRSNLLSVEELNISDSKVMKFNMQNNYPNPFNPSTKIQFDIPQVTNVTVNIYNVIGLSIVQIYQGVIQPGEYSFNWDATGLPAGIYYCRLSTDQYSKTIKMVLIK